MKVYNFIFYEEDDISRKKFSFILQKSKKKFIHVTMYQTNACLLNTIHEDYFMPDNLEENNFYELIFNDSIINSILKADLDYFSFNTGDNKKAFKKFQNEIKKISK